jgi:UDP-glucose 4-epimerase
MRVLVVGSTGFVGHHLVNHLIAGGFEVTTLDRRIGIHPKPTLSIRHESSLDINSVIAGQDAVVYCRWDGYALRSQGMASGLKANVGAAVEFFEALAKGPDMHLVFLSSGGAVYGQAKYLPIDERHETRPLNPYGLEKLAVESYLYYMARRFGLEHTILRPSSIYGPGQIPDRGQGLISTIMGRLQADKHIDILGDGSSIRDYLYIDDLIEAIVKVLRRGSTNSVFNIGSGSGTSILNVVTMIEAVTSKKLVLQYRPDSIINVDANVLDSTRAAKNLDWASSTSLESGIDATWKWVQDHSRGL